MIFLQEKGRVVFKYNVGKGRVMKPGYSLELVQTQKLVLTPELRQAIMVLQMNILELRDFIREEIEQNPLLEIATEREDDVFTDALEETNEEDWIQFFCDSSDLGLGQRLGRLVPSETPPYQELVQSKLPLQDYLLSQLRFLELSKDEFLLGEFIIGNIDDNGYLRCTVSEIALATGHEKPAVEKMLNVIQNMDPPGVGARDLRECLYLQAVRKSQSALVKHIIEDHLNDLAKGRYHKIAQDEKISVKEVLAARDSILTLDPKPGAKFSVGGINYIVPDIFVKRIGENFVITSNDNALPLIRWNSFYRSLLLNGEENIKSYLAQELRRAQVLLRSVEQRRVTVLRVMESIVSRQKLFFQKGPSYLQPMRLKDVAGDLGIHESTVSRAISNKYVDTPFGVFPCKMFFSPKVKSDGNDVSQYSVKKLIEEIVRSEDPRDPLSDKKIAMELEKRGVRVARRTVVKYRTQLGIPSSNRRRKL